jgi:hypothetical protein
MSYIAVPACVAWLVFTAADARAAFVDPSGTPIGATPFTNWTREDAGSTYQQWRGPANGGTASLSGGSGENFSTLFGLNLPDNDYYNPRGVATAQYLDEDRNSTGVTSGFLIAGAQNVYSFFASADWELISPDYDLGFGVTTTVILQLEVSGNEIIVGDNTPGHVGAPNTVKVDGFDWVDHVELARSGTVGGGFDTFDVTHWFRFEIPLNPPAHTIEFDSYDPSLGAFTDLAFGHMSVIAIAVDTFVGSPPPVLEGDLNSDGFVGIADLNIVLGNWNQNVTAGQFLLGDPTGDGFVGIADLNVVLGNWNAGTPPGGSVVPEPGVLGVLGVGTVGLLRRGR